MFKEAHIKTIIAGSRSIFRYSIVARAIEKSKFEITEVVSGSARCVDRLGEHWGIIHDVPVKRFPADWNNYGKSAGFRRNNEMAKYADALIAVWDGESKGTASMIRLAEEWGLMVFVYKVQS